MKRIVSKIIIWIMITILCFPITPTCVLAEDSEGSNPEKSDNGTTEEDIVESNLDALEMVNYLVVLSQAINASSNSKLYMEQAYSDIVSNINRNYIDKDTQKKFDSLLDIIESYKMISEKRDRLQYIFNQNKAQAIREAIPNPLGLISAVSSFDLKRIVASVVYMAVDAKTAYDSAIAKAELEYLKDNWQLDDEASAVLHQNRKSLFNYTIDMVRNYNLPDRLALTEKTADDFVANKNDKNDFKKIQFLTSHKTDYEAYGDYWLVLASCYYNTENYSACLDAFNEYEKLNVRIFRKDKDFAKHIPLALIALSEISQPSHTYENQMVHYLDLLEKNTNDEDWDLRYFAAQTYISLFAKTNNKMHLQKAYDLVKNNVSVLVEEQEKINLTYLNDIVTINEKAPDNYNGDKNSYRKEAKKYNEMLEDLRKTELPPIYEPLLLNCDLLFALANELKVSTNEKNNIEGILYGNDEKLFMTRVIKAKYSFSNNDIQLNSKVISLKKKTLFKTKGLTLGAEELTKEYQVKATITSEDHTEVLEDWIIDQVDRKKSNLVDNFVASFSSKMFNQYKFSNGDLIEFEILPTTTVECEPISFTFEVKISPFLWILKRTKFVLITE